MKNQIKKDRLIAMKEKDNLKKNLLSTLLGELDRSFKEPTNEQVIKTIKKLIDSNIEINSEDSLKENDILKKYMPEKLSTEELISEIDILINDNKYSSKDMSKIMSYFSNNYSGQYDGKILIELVKSKLIK
jgi:uncharacterized protein YqeY